MTVYLDRRFRGVGRIKRSAGTDHKPTIRLLDQMLTGLHERGRLDILKAIQKGEITPLQVWAYYRVNELEKLPTAQTMGQLEAKMKAWIEDKECSEAHRRSLHQSLRHIIASRKTATVADLPELLDALRGKMKAAKHPRSFNLAKAAAQAFIKTTLKRNHSLYHEITAIETLKVTQVRERHPLTVEEYEEVINKMKNLKACVIAITMAHTGMGWQEYTGRWDAKADRTVIHGTKRKGRTRSVPRLVGFAKQELSYKVFRADLAKASGDTVRPYDLRRTYANWLESAGIPRTRRRLYMGHGAGDVTDLYERHQVDAFLAEDAERLSRFIGATGKAEEVPRLKLEKA